MAADSQIAQSKMYWQSATPISIIEWTAKTNTGGDSNTYPYLRLRNSGVYPIRITGIVGADGGKATLFYGGGCNLSGWINISDQFYLGPGEEKYIGWSGTTGLACDRQIIFRTGVTTGYLIGGASSVCQNSTTSPSVIDYKTFGFEDIVYIDGQQITKRQIGKDLIIKCREPA
jgi:hypothetical protein